MLDRSGSPRGRGQSGGQGQAVGHASSSTTGKGTADHRAQRGAFGHPRLMMRKTDVLLSVLAALVAVPLAIWAAFYIRRSRFVRRDRLRRADAIIVLAGTRGNIGFLDGKIRTAVRLHQNGWAPSIICSGRFSAKVTDTPTLLPLEELKLAVAQGRIQEKDLKRAAETWDGALGACYYGLARQFWRSFKHGMTPPKRKEVSPLPEIYLQKYTTRVQSSNWTLLHSIRPFRPAGEIYNAKPSK